MKHKDRGDKPILGILSGRELFYFLFAIFVVAALIFYYWAIWGFRPSEVRVTPQAEENPKFKNGREAETAIESSGGYPISGTKILYFDRNGHPTNPWRIYDAKSDEITDGSYLAQPLAGAGSDLDALTNECCLSGWNGNIVLSTEWSTNHGQLIFQWTTNDEKLQVFSGANSATRRRHLFPSEVIAVDNGWLYAPAYYRSSGPILAAGNRIGSKFLATPFPANMLLASSWPFQGGIYVVATDTNASSIGIFVLSLTNQGSGFSNPPVRAPISSDGFLARPDPSGKHVVWLFAREPKFLPKLRGILPSFLVPDDVDEPTLYYYWSDLHATKFRFICSMKNPHSLQILWGVNGDSIWLPDTEKGIKQYQLK